MAFTVIAISFSSQQANVAPSPNALQVVECRLACSSIVLRTLRHSTAAIKRADTEKAQKKTADMRFPGDLRFIGYRAAEY
ncbi:MAG: hypothetical protein RLO21_12355, partial [Nitratireductor sp.]